MPDLLASEKLPSDTIAHSGKHEVRSSVSEKPDHSNKKLNVDSFSHDADLVTDLAAAEGHLSVRESIRTHPQAVLWSLFVSTSVIMVGYNSQIILSLFALPTFVARYGTVDSDGTQVLTASWQTAFSMGYAGQVIGALAVGWFSDRFGRRATMITCNLACIATNFIIFFAPNAAVLTVGEVLAGIPWGGFVQLGPLYAAEVTPVALRGILTAFTNMAWIVGQLVGQGVVAGCSTIESEWSYRIPFAVQWSWCLLLAIGSPFIPESPWYLVHKGDMAGAKKKSLERLCRPNQRINLDERLEIMRKTDLMERSAHAATSWWDLFRGADRRRTEISAMVYAVQVFCGIPLSWYCNYFFALAGLETGQVFNLGVGNVAVGVPGTVITFVMLSYIGRRKIFVSGLTVLTTLMFVIAILDTPASYDTNPSLSWAQAVLLMIWTFFYQSTIGPVSYVFIGEVSSAKLRSRTIAFGTASFFVALIVASVALPYMLNPGSGNLRGKSGFVFGGLSFLCLVWAYFRLPETKGRTVAEIDYLFEHGVPSRHFGKHRIVAYAE